MLIGLSKKTSPNPRQPGECERTATTLAMEAGSRPLSEMPALMSSRRIMFFPRCNVTVTVGVFHPEHPPSNRHKSSHPEREVKPPVFVPYAISTQGLTIWRFRQAFIPGLRVILIQMQPYSARAPAGIDSLRAFNSSSAVGDPAAAAFER